MHMVANSFLSCNSYLQVPAFIANRYHDQMRPKELRTLNLKLLINEFGSIAEVSRRSGVNEKYLSQVGRGDVQRKSPRGLGDESVEKLELGCGKQPGWMDTLHANSPVEPYNVTPGPELRGKVPLISLTRAGNWCEAVDVLHPGDAEDWIDTTAQVKRHTYALRVEGDSMEPDFPAGTILIVEPEMDPQPGDYVIMKNGGDATFKQLIKDGPDYYLKPLNPRYPIKPVPEGAHVCGVVREAVRKFR